MKKVFLLLILLAALLFTAGCTEDQKDPRDLQDMPEQSTTPVDTPPINDSVVEVTALEQINTSLQKGPVLVKIGSERCGACVKMKPILKKLAKEYSGKATIMSLDIDESPELASYFGVSFIPDSFVIVSIQNGKYVYMREDGNTNIDRIKSRILGLTDKEVFETILDYSLPKQGK